MGKMEHAKSSEWKHLDENTGSRDDEGKRRPDTRPAIENPDCQWKTAHPGVYSLTRKKSSN